MWQCAYQYKYMSHLLQDHHGMFRVFEYHPYPYLSIYVCRILLCRIPHGFMSLHINHADPNFVNPSLATAILATRFALLSPAMRTVYWFQSSYSSKDIGTTTALTSITVAACGASISLLHDRFLTSSVALRRLIVKLAIVRAAAKHCSCSSSLHFMVAFGRRTNFLRGSSQ